jgi:hypothetical protein
MASAERHHVFTPLDLEIIDLVYEAAWAQIIARDPSRNFHDDPGRQALLRKKIFAVAQAGPVDFDIVLDKVLWISPEMWVASPRPHEQASA